MTLRTPLHAAARDSLARTDAALRGAVGPLGSLAPGRGSATPLVVVGEQLLDARVSEVAGQGFAQALSRVMLAQAECFPATLFWDAELAAVLLLQVVVADEGAGEPRATRVVDAIVALQHEFGRGSKIQFRYSHDFAYGFDWARWVRRDADARRGVGPYGEQFLAYMRRRGQELDALIEQDDAKYPRLPPGVARNPFGFSREPADEGRLLRDLAERGLVPVPAWELDAVPRWDLPFAELREERARALGLCLPSRA